MSFCKFQYTVHYHNIFNIIIPYSNHNHCSAANLWKWYVFGTMIDLNTYRQRIGGFNPHCKGCKREGRGRKGRGSENSGKRVWGTRFNEDIKTRSFEDSLRFNPIFVNSCFIYMFVTLYVLFISLFSTLFMMHYHTFKSNHMVTDWV